MKSPVKKRQLMKHSGRAEQFVRAAERNFVRALVQVEATPQVIARIEQLTQHAARAKGASFLSRYRVTSSA